MKRRALFVGFSWFLCACGPSASSPETDDIGGSSDSTDELDAGSASDTSAGGATSADSGSSSETGALTGGAEACAWGPIDGVDTVITGGFTRDDDRLTVKLGSSVSRECGGVGCDGWQIRLLLDAQTEGPAALGSEVTVVHASAYSSCDPRDAPEVCNSCSEEDRVETDETTPWTGTVELVADDDGCLQLRLLDADLLRYNNDPGAPTNFGVNVTRCD